MTILEILLTIGGACGAISAIIALIAIIRKWLINIEAKKIEKVVDEQFKKQIAPLFKSTNEMIEQNNQKIDLLNDKMNQLEIKVDKNERDRLKAEILQFADNLRHGQEPSEVSFQNIYRTHEKYHALGGNGFEQQAIDYIRNKYNEIFNEPKE